MTLTAVWGSRSSPAPGRPPQVSYSRALLETVEPYTSRARLSLPKLRINGTKDPWWTLDSMNVYWDDLSGPKWVVYLPNAGHGQDQYRDYAISGISAQFRHAIGDKPFPKLSWRFEESGSQVKLFVTSDPAPKSAEARTATSPTPDSRQYPLASMPLDASMTAARPKTEVGNVALFADLESPALIASYRLGTECVLSRSITRTNRSASLCRPSIGNAGRSQRPRQPAGARHVHSVGNIEIVRGVEKSISQLRRASTANRSFEMGWTWIRIGQTGMSDPPQARVGAEIPVCPIPSLPLVKPIGPGLSSGPLRLSHLIEWSVF